MSGDGQDKDARRIVYINEIVDRLLGFLCSGKPSISGGTNAGILYAFSIGLSPMGAMSFLLAKPSGDMVTITGRILRGK